MEEIKIMLLILMAIKPFGLGNGIGDVPRDAI